MMDTTVKVECRLPDIQQGRVVSFVVNDKDKAVRRSAEANTRDRLITLSRPKESKAIWATSYSPRVMWGTQDMLWTVSENAKKAEPSPRVLQLAEPKKDFMTGIRINRDHYVYSCGRSSVLWDVSPSAKNANCSERVGHLAKFKVAPKEFQPDRAMFFYSCGRSSPLWQVSRASKNAKESPHLERLATPKTNHPDFLGARPIQTIIPRAAMLASPSDRIERLSTPKNKPDGPFRDPIWPVAGAAKTATATQRTTDLSKSKGVVEGYVANRDDPAWPVSRGARMAVASARTNELSVPIVRATMDHLQFDPDAFIVKETAKKGSCSRRTEELAQPIQR
ncbi:sperm microtubule associated protein 2-like isoform X1 [Tubulanus polymorphus]|uniref:sperm microtubule associated protein 2-like isoform X1 n=1 Tax=Tubulanus polymorphus TaxID=672921 RepID=UPI003DA6CA6B